VQADVASRVTAAALAVGEPWGAARAGLSAFLDACLEEEFRRIVIIDSVAVLHKDVWADPIERIELPMLRAVLSPLVDGDILPGLTAEALVHVALGGLYGAALYTARSPNPSAAQAEADAVIDTIMRGLRSGIAGPANQAKRGARRRGHM
jgi:hypothetical protein